MEYYIIFFYDCVCLFLYVCVALDFDCIYERIHNIISCKLELSPHSSFNLQFTPIPFFCMSVELPT